MARVAFPSVSDAPILDPSNTAATRIALMTPALATFALGFLILFCVGFMQVSVVHNGAHDTRHADGFPCH